MIVDNNNDMKSALGEDRDRQGCGERTMLERLDAKIDTSDLTEVKLERKEGQCRGVD